MSSPEPTPPSPLPPSAPGPEAPDDLAERMRREVAEGLSRRQKELSPKYFYDRHGSELFEEITRLPEYYLTRAERALLESFVPAFVGRLRPASLVELGAGAADKTRILLDAIAAAGPGARYVPIDISSEFLETVAGALRSEYPTVAVTPVVGDISSALHVPRDLGRPVLFALLGSTIGNFRPAAAMHLLGRVRAQMGDGDRFLLGADLIKDAAVLERAYNDSRGVTAEFNLNVLRVLNRELGADFNLSGFRHRAFYHPDHHRIEMHLVAERPTAVRIPGAGEFRLGAGETIRTEISCKYDRARISHMFDEAGLELEQWVVGAPGFALAVGRPAGSP